MKNKFNFGNSLIAFSLLLSSPGLMSQVVVFEKTYDFSSEDRISDMIQLPDNNFILVGSTINSNGFDDILIIKLNSDGDTLFTRIFNHDTVAVANKIIRLSDDNFIIAGSLGDQALLVKMNQNMDTLWNKLYSDEYKCSFQNIVELSNSDLVVAEWIEIYPTTSKLLRLSNSGELISAISEPGSSYVGLVRTPTDDIYVSGYGGESYAPNFLLRKFDSNCNPVFYNSYNDILGVNTCLSSEDQNYYLGGTITTENSYHPGVIKTDENGLVDWIHTFENVTFSIWLMDMAIDENHRLFFLMEDLFYDQFYIAVLNQTNEQIGYGTFEISHPGMSTIIVDNAYLYVSGSVDDETGGSDAYVIKLYADSLITGIRPCLVQNTTQINLFPNPAKNVLEVVTDNAFPGLHFNIAIFNSSGIKVRSIDNFNTLISRDIDISTLPEGIYLMFFDSKVGGSIVKKFIISR
jgi:hypothetical protein